MKILPVSDAASLEKVFPVIRQLRPHLDFVKFQKLYEEAQKDSRYELVAIWDESGHCLAAMGYRVLTDLVHGRHLYVDDLVVSENLRSSGLGAKLLSHAEQIAREYQCDNLRLSTGLDNERGKKFYEKEGWTFRSVTFKKKLQSA